VIREYGGRTKVYHGVMGMHPVGQLYLARFTPPPCRLYYPGRQNNRADERMPHGAALRLSRAFLSFERECNREAPCSFRIGPGWVDCVGTGIGGRFSRRSG
jgi:hypothetical protein